MSGDDGRGAASIAGSGQVLGLGAGIGDARRDRFPDMAQLVPRERRLLGDAKARKCRVGADRSRARQVVEREHALLGAGRLG